MPRQRPPATTGEETDGAVAASGEDGIDPTLPWPPDVLTVPDLARYLRFSEQHTRKMADEGKVPGWKIGSAWRFSRVAIDRRLSGDDS